MAVELQKLGYTNLHALDISQEMLNEAKKKNFYKKIICAPLNDQRIPEIETGEFDALICGGTLIKGLVRSLAFLEMVRMVRTGEFFYLLLVNVLNDVQSSNLRHRPPHENGHVFVPTDGTHIHSYFNLYTGVLVPKFRGSIRIDRSTDFPRYYDI